MTIIEGDVIVLPDLHGPFVGDNVKVRNLFDSLYVWLHHIFSKNYLQTVKHLKQVDYNQIANMIYSDYHKNIKISDKPPHKYWSEILEE